MLPSDRQHEKMVVVAQTAVENSRHPATLHSLACLFLFCSLNGLGRVGEVFGPKKVHDSFHVCSGLFRDFAAKD